MVSNRGPPLSDTNSALPSDADLAALAALINGDSSDENAGNNLAELVAQLECADSVARGTEGRLDQLLEQLDGIVEGLEAFQKEQSSSSGRDDVIAEADSDVASGKQRSESE